MVLTDFGEWEVSPKYLRTAAFIFFLLTYDVKKYGTGEMPQQTWVQFPHPHTAHSLCHSSSSVFSTLSGPP